MFRSGAVDCREPSSVTVAVIVYAVVLILVGAVYWRAIGPERAELTDVRYAGPTIRSDAPHRASIYARTRGSGNT